MKNCSIMKKKKMKKNPRSKPRGIRTNPNKKVLVTGEAGFFGSILSKYLKKKGLKVVIFDIYYDKSLALKFDYFLGDLRRKKDLEKCFKKFGPFKTVYHIAAMLAHDIKEKKSLWRSNVNGTKNLIEVCLKNKSPKINLFSYFSNFRISCIKQYCKYYPKENPT